MSKRQAWCVVVLYAIAMAWVESAVVVYLRTLIHRIDPYQTNPLPMFGGLGEIELGREASTLVMLLMVGWLAGRTWRSRIAYAAVAFGVWDTFYYILLVPMTGWPSSLFDWDILFLLPLPWWGPVIAPASIAALMIIGGTMITQFDKSVSPRRLSMVLALLGVVLALYVFMADAIRVASGGVESIRGMLPIVFNWRLFGVAFLLMTTPIVDMSWQLWRKGKLQRTSIVRRSLSDSI